MNPLLIFYKNIPEREAVKDFLVDTMKEMAIERAFNGKSTLGIQEARECIDKMFDRLEEVYGEKEEPIIKNSR